MGAEDGTFWTSPEQRCRAAGLLLPPLGQVHQSRIGFLAPSAHLQAKQEMVKTSELACLGLLVFLTCHSVDQPHWGAAVPQALKGPSCTFGAMFGSASARDGASLWRPGLAEGSIQANGSCLAGVEGPASRPMCPFGLVKRHHGLRRARLHGSSGSGVPLHFQPPPCSRLKRV